MKYIRTENGISKLVDDWALFCKEHASNEQADTIEELCDEFVWKAPNNTPLIVPNIYNTNIEKEIKNGRIIYGAIWTEWGLKYVAKMNDKGELVLL